MGKNHLLLDGTIIVMLVNVLSNKQQQLKHPQRMIVQFPIGLETIIVMMKTTLLDVDLMEEIVAKNHLLMDGTTIAQTVNVLNFQQLLKPQEQIVLLLIGLVILIVMMKTTMLNVALMVEIVVGMSIHNIALLVNVSNNSCQKHLITIHRNKEKHAQL